MTSQHLYILLAACLWGSIGVWVRLMTGSGLTAADVVACRAVGAGIVFTIAILLADKRYLQVKLEHLWIFFAAGFICFPGFSGCNFICIGLSSLGVASLLEYTAPIFILLLSICFLHEKLTKYKLLALVASFAGCVFITGALEENTPLNLPVIGFGLASGVGYALYCFFNKLALNRGYHPLTVTAYNFYFCALAALLYTRDIPLGKLTAHGWIGYAGLVIFCSFMANLFYNKGLSTIDAGLAGIIATLEPFAATIIGLLFYNEIISPSKMLGMGLILGSIILLNWKGE